MFWKGYALECQLGVSQSGQRREGFEIGLLICVPVSSVLEEHEWMWMERRKGRSLLS